MSKRINNRKGKKNRVYARKVTGWQRKRRKGLQATAERRRWLQNPKALLGFLSGLWSATRPQPVEESE